VKLYIAVYLQLYLPGTLGMYSRNIILEI